MLICLYDCVSLLLEMAEYVLDACFRVFGITSHRHLFWDQHFVVSYWAQIQYHHDSIRW